jgi:glycosyltransferase involved in cell wall biosynthesis
MRVWIMRVVMDDHRVAFSVPNLRNGGAERAMTTLASECAELGWDVDLVLLEDRNADYADEVSPRVRVVNLHQQHVRTSVPALMRYLRQQHPAALFSTLSHMNCAVAVAARIACVRTRLVLREADTMSEYSNFMRFLISNLYRGADSTVAVSEDVKKDLVLKARLPADRICVIRNPVDVNRVRQLACAELQIKFLADEAPLIVSAGRLEPQKDFGTLLRAFASVRSHRRCHLAILGRGSQLLRLQQYANDLDITESVVFAGYVENPYAWMARCKVLVLSSVHEGCPNVLLEGLACGCSVVATDAPGDARFLLRGGTLGRLVPVGDWHEMAQAIEMAVDEDRGATMKARVEEWLQTFDPRTAAIAYLAVAGLPPQPGGRSTDTPSRRKEKQPSGSPEVGP